MRGLKSIIKGGTHTGDNVALLVSAWIEISMVISCCGTGFVALLVSAWIEMCRAFEKKNALKRSHSL